MLETTMKFQLILILFSLFLLICGQDVGQINDTSSSSTLMNSLQPTSASRGNTIRNVSTTTLDIPQQASVTTEKIVSGEESISTSTSFQTTVPNNVIKTINRQNISTSNSPSTAGVGSVEYSNDTEVIATDEADISSLTPSTSATTAPTTAYNKARDPKFLMQYYSRNPDISATETTLSPSSTITPTESTSPLPTSPKLSQVDVTIQSYSPSPLPHIDNHVFKEFARLSKLTEYMLIDPRFADDYAADRLSNRSKILYMVYGDVVKHIFSSEPLTQRAPPKRKNRIRYRIKSLNDKPPRVCSESGRETARIFCPFSYGYNWWDCLMPDEVCDGVPHCGLGDDEDPKMCLYYRAAVSKLNQIHENVLSDIAKLNKLREYGVRPTFTLESYNPDIDL